LRLRGLFLRVVSARCCRGRHSAGRSDHKAVTKRHCTAANRIAPDENLASRYGATGRRRRPRRRPPDRGSRWAVRVSGPQGV
jgi:hypothetical protein